MSQQSSRLLDEKGQPLFEDAYTDNLIRVSFNEMLLKGATTVGDFVMAFRVNSSQSAAEKEAAVTKFARAFKVRSRHWMSSRQPPSLLPNSSKQLKKARHLTAQRSAKKPRKNPLQILTSRKSQHQRPKRSRTLPRCNRGNSDRLLSD
jgi:hypothetical protein